MKMPRAMVNPSFPVVFHVVREVKKVYGMCPGVHECPKGSLEDGISFTEPFITRVLQ